MTARELLISPSRALGVAAAFMSEGQVYMNARKATVADGAQVVARGRADGPCCLPTVLVNVTQNAHLYRDETFGPVRVVEGADNVEQAVQAANDHRYGLRAGIITSDPDAGLAFASQVESGMQSGTRSFPV